MMHVDVAEIVNLEFFITKNTSIFSTSPLLSRNVKCLQCAYVFLFIRDQAIYSSTHLRNLLGFDFPFCRVPERRLIWWGLVTGLEACWLAHDFLNLTWIRILSNSTQLLHHNLPWMQGRVFRLFTPQWELLMPSRRFHKLLTRITHQATEQDLLGSSFSTSQKG